MRSNTFQWKKVKRWFAAAGLFLCLMVITVPVFADEETKPVTETTEETTAPAETETKKEPEQDKQESETKESVPVLPSGNLTLVDDVISASDGHREFLTVVSREGSYFYIVIDRDTQGAGNVYFLNLVDEQDLYKLTGEEAPQVIEQEVSPQIITEPQKQEEEATKQPEQSDEEKAAEKQKSLMITVGVGAAIAVGIIIYLLKKKKSKRQKQQEFDLSDFEDDDE